MKRFSMVIALFCIAACGHVHNTTSRDEGDDADGDVALADVSDTDRSPWDSAGARGSHAIVAAANWTDPIGSIAAIDLDDISTAVKGLTTTDGTDIALRSFGGFIFVINRFGTDTIQVIDPRSFAVVANYSVGAGSNPQDIYVRSNDKAYISRLDAHNDAGDSRDLIIVDPLRGARLGGIDLKPCTADDGDRRARATRMVAVGDMLYVLVQDLPSNLMEPANQPGKIAVIDMTSDEIVHVIELEGRNPSDITHSPVTNMLYVAATGVFVNFVADVGDPYGGIEEIDPVAMSTRGIIIDDADFGGYVMGVRLAEERAYTIVEGSRIASFDIELGEVLSSHLYESAGSFLPDIAVDDKGRLLATERDAYASGIVFIDGASGAIIAGPIDVGALPAAITFVDRE